MAETTATSQDVLQWQQTSCWNQELQHWTFTNNCFLCYASCSADDPLLVMYLYCSKVHLSCMYHFNINIW